MHSLLITLASTTATTVAGSSSKKGSSTLPLLILVAVFAGAYIFFIRPRQQRMRGQQTKARQLAVGDDVVSIGGIHGKVVAIDSDVAEVEVSPGVVLTFLRRAVNAQPGTASPPASPPPEDDKWDVTPSGAGPAIGHGDDVEDTGTGSPDSEPPRGPDGTP